MKTVDEYLENASPAQRAEFERIRKIVKKLVPKAEETISYGIPTFKYKGKYLLYFGAFRNHMSVFPGSELASSLKAKLEGYKISKGTVQYTEGNPVPEWAVKEIVTHRLAAISK